MIHELHKILKQARQWNAKGRRTALATVVGLEGSSYRKPGVQMLVAEDGDFFGAISGGCVEKEVVRRAMPVFEHGESLVISYDGRYRLGCEGTLFILVEPIEVSEDLLSRFEQMVDARIPVEMRCDFIPKDGAKGHFGSSLSAEKLSVVFNPESRNETVTFRKKLEPWFRLLIIGSGHDAERFADLSSRMGWDVQVVVSPGSGKSGQDFPGVQSVHIETPDSFDASRIDQHTAVVLMTHGYSQDLRYYLALKDRNPVYVGILGSRKRRNRMLMDLVEYAPELFGRDLESIHSPAGLDIGSITPEEIAVSILAEILAVVRGKLNPIEEKLERLESSSKS